MMILVFNAGSSTLKFGCFEAETLEPRATGLIDWTGHEKAEVILKQKDKSDHSAHCAVKNYPAAVRTAIETLREQGIIPPDKGPSQIAAVGHRVVHGGTAFRSPALIDEKVKAAIADLSKLAPLHNPPALEVIVEADRLLPGVPQVAVFDTAFFSNLEPFRYIYPLPYDWYARGGIRRFGFHGISHQYCAGRAAELLRKSQKNLRLIVCHLGNGCSATAIRDGRPVSTTMGFTPLEGLMMGSRSGSIDPGILLHLQLKKGLSTEELERILNHESGLLGVSGVSSDYRAVEKAAREGNERAQLALDIYTDRVRSTIGSLAVTLGRVDALIFTGGVGENAFDLRAAVCEMLSCLGLEMDPDKNRSCRSDDDIASKVSEGRILVVHTQEEIVVGRETRRVIGERFPLDRGLRD